MPSLALQRLRRRLGGAGDGPPIPVPLQITGSPITSAIQNEFYAGFTLGRVGGTGTVVYSIHAGSLPAGITLNASTGEVSGRPTGSGTSPDVIFRVTDALGATDDLDPVDFIVEAAGTPVLPSALTITMYRDTRKGFDGRALNYAGDGYLKIVAGDASRFQIDAYNRFCPNGPGLYGTANGGLEASSYSLTIAEYSDAGLTNPTGRTMALTVDMAAGAGVLGGHPSDSSSSNQLRTMLTSALVRPYDIWADGYWNPTSNPGGTLWRIRPPAWAGTGRVTVRSQNPDVGLTPEGNPRNEHGFRIGGLVIESNIVGNVEIPLDFEDVWFLATDPKCDRGVGGAASATTITLFDYNTAGYGINFYNCRCSADPSLITPEVIGINANLPCTVEDTSFYKVNDGFKNGGSATGNGLNAGMISRRNTFWDLNGDEHSCGEASDVVIEDMFTFRPRYTSPVFHKDPIQFVLKRGATAVQVNNVTLRRNISVYGDGLATNGAQQSFIYIDDALAGSDATNFTIENNLALFGNVYGIFMDTATGPAINRNTVLCDISNILTTKSAVGIRLQNDGGGAGGATLSNNVANTFNTTLLPGVVTNTNAVTLANNAGAVSAAFPAYSPAATQTCVNRALAMAMMTPANLAVGSGGVKNPDNTYSGAIGPDGGWNTGGVYA